MAVGLQRVQYRRDVYVREVSSGVWVMGHQKPHPYVSTHTHWILIG